MPGANKVLTTIATQWEIRRGSQVYRVPDARLLLKIKQEGRLKETDLIRRSGDSQWRSAESMDWAAVDLSQQDSLTGQTLIQPADVDSHSTPSLVAEAADAASIEESAVPKGEHVDSRSADAEGHPSIERVSSLDATTVVIHAASLTPAEAPHQSSAEDDWWHATAAAGNRSRPAFRLPKLVVGGSVLLAVLAVTGGLLQLSNARTYLMASRPPQLGPTAAAGQTDNAVKAYEPADSEDERHPKTDASTLSIGGARSDLVASQPGVAEIAAPAAVSDTPEHASMPHLIEERPAEAEPEAHAEANSTDSVKVMTADQPSAAGQATSQAPGRSETVSATVDNAAKEEDEPSATELQNSQDPIDRIYDQIQATVTFHRNTYANLREGRKQFSEAEAAVIKLSAQIEQAQNALIQVGRENTRLLFESERIRELQRLTRGASIDHEHMQNQVQTSLAQLGLQRARLDASIITFSRSREVEIGRRQRAEKDCLEVIRKEEIAVHNLMDAIDLLGELPLEVHKRLADATAQWLAEEPDLFIGYLLQSAAAVRNENFDVPLENVEKMKLQVSVMPIDERALRKKSLDRFNNAALALVGLSHYARKQYPDAVRCLKGVLSREQNTIEFWILRGRVGMEHKGLGDANEYFRRAIAQNPRSPLAYRCYLQALLTQDGVSREVLQKLLDNLVARTTNHDDNSWLVATEVALRLEEFHKAAEYIDKVTDPWLAERRATLDAAITKRAARAEAD